MQFSGGILYIIINKWLLIALCGSAGQKSKVSSPIKKKRVSPGPLLRTVHKFLNISHWNPMALEQYVNDDLNARTAIFLWCNR